MGGREERDFSLLLRRLKERSGRSYEDLAAASFVSRSTLHRYCNGKSVPSDIGVVMRIARECGAGSRELQEVLRAWSALAAPGGEAGAAEETGAGPGRPAAESAESAASAEQAPRRAEAVPRSPGTGGATGWRRVLGIVLVLAGLAGSASAAGSAAPPRETTRAAQWISGPSWVRAPAPVRRELFGVTMNSNTGTMPSFRVGAVRFWDSGTRWASIEPRRGEYDWSTLDRLVTGANRAGLPALFVFGGTPAWAAPQAPPGPYGDQSRAGAPDDLADWEALVRTLVTRYRGRIEAYELWVMGNDERFFTGGVPVLVEMTRRAARIIRRIDPRATVVCPGMGRLWDPGARRALERFAELGGYRHCDAAGIKLHQRRASDPPETMLQVLRLVDRVFHRLGVHPPLWNTGTSYDIPLQGSLDERRAADYAVRFYLLGLYATNLNLKRMYFYNWGGNSIPVVLQAEGGAPTRAALAVEQLQRWLAHARLRSCGQGLAIELPDNVWQCEFTVAGPEGEHAAVLRWTHQGTASIAAPGARNVWRLDGSGAPVRPGDVVQITEQPVFITY
ncbi:helix-turn-helix domain-containing protein [Planomonospora sp. ID67723]|uniref:helix-turn-helix domain-containing protein n=1 Tax=Planomonospora sp. ID67723 TaxID=2738134 RepID=UPI0018C37B03|nr:helix-turn-helix transcriptional regulator [Planomonospora sp. ID67723]MBG0831800.1 helix-turn-helix domain-containing protein [Planomonospora sp. ID67723]